MSHAKPVKGKVKLGVAVIAILADGRQRSFKEMLPYLSRRIDPKTAVNTYENAHKQAILSGKPQPGLDEQISKGTALAIFSALKIQEDAGNIVLQRPEGFYHGLQVEHMKAQLSPDGVKVLWAPHDDLEKGALSKQTEVWKELRYARSQGWLAVDIDLEVKVKKDVAPRNGRFSAGETPDEGARELPPSETEEPLKDSGVSEMFREAQEAEVGPR